MAKHLNLVRQLRDETGYSIMLCKKALEEAEGNIAKAKDYLHTHHKDAIASKKSERETKNGIVASYVHTNKRVGVLLELACETDFVANTEEFHDLAAELALHIAGMDPKNPEELLSQAYVREPERSVKDVIGNTITKLGENIAVSRFVRYAL